jgi:hypothetical protein
MDLMAFRNECCRAFFRTVSDPRTGDIIVCPVCGNEHVWEGLRWSSRFELGPQKMRKLSRIRHADEIARGRLGL